MDYIVSEINKKHTIYMNMQLESGVNDNKNQTIQSYKQINYSRWDFYFSYWIFTWATIYLLLFWMYKTRLSNLYILFFIRYCNPILLIIFALVENIIGLFIIWLKNAKYIIILLYIFVILITKLIPIWLLANTNFKPNITNIVINLSFFLMYWLYLINNKINIIDLYYYSIDNLIKGKTPFFHYVLSNISIIP
jgi:hypothetical protein